MTCDEIKDLAPAFALGLLDEAERLECARHLAQPGPHAGCADAVAEAREVSARLAAALPALAPPPRLWRTIEANLRNNVPDPSAPAWLRDLGGWFIMTTLVGFLTLSALGYELNASGAHRRWIGAHAQLTPNGCD